MNIPDIINGSFEIFGGVFGLTNVWQLYKDKHCSGVHWGSTIFFTLWGIWNLVYYPYLNQWLSFYGGIFLTLTSVIWAIQRIYYTYYVSSKCKHPIQIPVEVSSTHEFESTTEWHVKVYCSGCGKFQFIPIDNCDVGTWKSKIRS